MADSKAVATKQTSAVAAFDDDMMKEAEALGGAGRTTAMEDNVVPRLNLLQDMSPEAKKRDPEYVEGAEPGMILNTATRQLSTQLEVQPWATDRCINQWTPRDAGGGFRGRHPLVGTVEDSMKAAGGTSKPDPQDPNKTVWGLPNGDQLIDTRYVYVNVIEREGGVPGEGAIVKSVPAVISFSSTGHTVAKQWSTLRNNSVLPNGNEHPIWFRSYLMKTKPAKNNKGEFFVFDFLDLGDKGWITDKRVHNQAKALFESFSAGNIRSSDEVDTGDKKAEAADVI